VVIPIPLSPTSAPSNILRHSLSRPVDFDTSFCEFKVLDPLMMADAQPE
jgi:hypothetical protein